MESHTYHRLGLFSFWMFVLQDSIVAFSGLLLFFVALALKMTNIGAALPSGTDGTPDLAGATDTLLNLAVLGSFALLIAGVAVAFILAVIQYYSYRYTLGEHEMHIKRGILNTDEITIPYRHIIDIEIERPLIYQILGASILTIYSRTDTNAGDGTNDESEGRLPAIRKNFAEKFREDLLKKAHEQDIGRG
ncbi:MAG: PH domain-containing protein [Candidatus Paceibacterota bacterium]|jgi:uncharacterized membrane protein YdbT with pleckstrin-like domain